MVVSSYDMLRCPLSKLALYSETSQHAACFSESNVFGASTKSKSKIATVVV